MTEIRTAIVTGAARGIGAATAKRLSADGMKVAVLDLDAAAAQPVVDEIVAAGGQAIAVGADVSDSDSVKTAVDLVANELGAPTVIVNNAGIIRDNLLFKMNVDEWDLVMAVHLRGAFNTVKHAQQYMVEAKHGRIINLSSTSAQGNRGQANYSAAKAGLQGYTKTLAIELGKYGVTANAVAPGFTVTEMIEETAARIGVTLEEFKEHAAKDIPVARVGYPEDIANAISFFADEKSGYVSGQVLYVAGGPKD